MRQNPIMSSRVQVGGRPMPSWFSASLVNQSRTAMATPPPLPAEPPPSNEESEYEEIDHYLRNKTTGARRPVGGRRACNLCGNPNPVVSCDMCDNQIFCGSCNDMYHRHPKRLHHVRKILETLENRPPLPPKTFLPSPPVNENSASLPPVPPPRRNKRFGMRSATSSPTTTRKVFDPVGSIKRFVGGMGQRPLPPPPKQGPPLPPKTFELGRAMTPTLRGPNLGIDRRHSSPQAPNLQMRPSEHRARHFPNAVPEMQHPRNQSVSVANLSNQHSTSRENGFNDWEDDEDYFARQRAHSISTVHGGRFPASSSQDVSHFATLQRPKRGSLAPERPPPPVPPRNFSSQTQLGFQSSQSAFNLNQMGLAPQFGMPWNYPGQGYPFDYQQQAMMMGYPGGTMRRTPSNQSMGGGMPSQQQFFGWGPMGFGPPMSQQEMEMEIMAARRGSEPPVFANQRPHSVTQSQPVTPQGSFRKKTRPSMNHDRQAMADERFMQSQQTQQRSSTPSSFARVKPSAQIRESNFQPLLARKPNTSNEFDSSNQELERTEEPEGPWTCEHCTFINPKSTKVCTICCKTPSDGYRCTGQVKSNYRRKESTTSSNDEIPVVNSKLSISRGEKQQATINLVERVERVSTPTDPRPPRAIQFSQSSAYPKSSNNEYEEYEDQNEQDLDEQELVQQAQRHQIKIDTKKPMKTVKPASKMSNSNEDVYGSVPVQTLTISPKIEIRRPPKTSTTGVGSSPPKMSIEDKVVRSSPQQTNAQPETVVEKANVNKEKPGQGTKPSPTNSSRSRSSDSNSADDKTQRLNTAVKATAKDDKVEKSSLKSLSPKPATVSVSTGIQADGTGESSNESGAHTSSSGSRSSDSISPASMSLGKRSEDSQPQVEMKSSKGTSPPPQSISTQTYEELPASSMRQQPMSKTSNTSMQSLQSSEDFAPPKPVQMSEKALRYARKAQHHHQAKLKRSMSTHLTSAAEPWVDTSSDGRHLYRSSSRHSLMSDTRSLPLSGPPSRDTSPPSYGGSRFYEDFKRFATPSWDRFPTPEDYFASLEDLVTRRRKDSVRSQEFELTRLLKDAEEYNYTPEDVQVALRMCGERNPIKWLQENWSSMIETVQTLATKYGREKGQENNQIGTVSSTEAKDALRTHKGNVWAAVTECVEQRRKKFKELQSRGTFLREDILTALTANHGNLDAAYVELSKAQLKPFLMRIWGPPSGLDNDAIPPTSSIKSLDTEPELSKNSGDKKDMTVDKPTLEEPKSASIDEFSNRTSESKSDVSKVQSSVANQVIDPDISVTKLEAQNELLKDEGEIAKLKQLEPEPRLEMLVTNAAKVTQEIEKALQELKLSKSKPAEINETTSTASSNKESELEMNENTTRPYVHSVKSDEGEDESFADAVSDSDLNAASPILDGQQDPIEEMENEEEDDYDEDILEIEIDDSEANISEFIQNYEVVPARSQAQPETSLDSEGNYEVVQLNQSELPTDQQVPGTEKAEGSNSNDNPAISEDQSPTDSALAILQAAVNPTDASDAKNINRLSSAEIEQLLNTLTTTFTEMGQFATEIKAKIATEIQQQLAVAVNLVATNTDKDQNAPGTSSQGGQAPQVPSNDPVYEPILLPESTIENVDKKIAKYKRLAAKKQQKSSRHKSPESRVSGKSTSTSPSPASSTANVSSQGPAVGPEIPESTYTNAEIEIIENPDGDDDGIPPEDNERDEGEYNSGSESVESSGEIVEDEGGDEEEEVVELEEEDLESVEESDISSEEVEEEEEISEEEDGVYEEVDINSSDYDLYNNKDTNKLITNAGSQKLSFATPATEFALTEPENLGTEEAVAAFEAQLALSVKPKSELEIKVARLIEEGKTETVEKAELAMQLMDMNFLEEDSIYAANECSSLYAALSYLQQECDLCAGKFSARQMVSMLRCTHVCCQHCAKEYFTVQIRDKTIIDATCPFCSEPSNLTDEPELATDYFTHLDILLKSFLETRIHEMFQRKLRDWALAKTPNFKWCSKCSSGFITEPLQTRLICPDCNAVTCAICLESWDKFNHDHRESKVKVCDSSSKSIVDYLNENSIECPRCHFRFALARGGCMHLTCTQCRHDFCSGCSASFRMGDKCEAKLPVCDRLGLHAHHPRNCLFYLRDKEPETLCKLLEENAIPYLKENSGTKAHEVSAKNTSSKRECQVPIQKETSEGLKDDICGKDAPAGYATVCKAHYVEYLGLLIWQNHLDPISILSSDDLEVIIRRAYKKHPGRPYPTSDEEFRNRLLRVIQEEIPL